MYFRMHVALTASLSCLLFQNFGRTLKFLIPYPQNLLPVFLFLCSLATGYTQNFTEYQFQWVEETSEFSLDGNRSPNLTLFENCSYLIRSSGAELSLIDGSDTLYDGDEMFSNQIEGNGEYILLTPNQNTPRQLFYQNVNDPSSVKGHIQIKEYTDLGLIKMNQPTAFSRFGSMVVITDDETIFTSATGYNQNEGLVSRYDRSNDGNFYHHSDLGSPLNEDAFWGSYLFFDEYESKLLIGSSNAEDFRGSLYAYSLSSMENRVLFQGEKMGDLLGWSFATSGEKLIVSALSVTEATGGHFSLFSTPYTIPLEIHQKVQPSRPQFGNEFGYSLSFDGDSIVIGAPGEDDLIRQDCGAVYLYRMDENTMTSYKVIPAQRSDGDRFGQTVMLEGDFIFVGSPSGDGRSPSSGLTHVFKLKEEDLSIEEIYNILPPDAGSSQKFSQNLFTIGNFVFISSPGSGDFGVVYVYKQTSSSNVWELVHSIHLDQFSEKLSRGDNISLHVNSGILALGLEKESSEEPESGAIQTLYNPAWDVSSYTQIPPFFENNTLLEVDIEEDTPEIVVDFNATLPTAEQQLVWEINSSSNAITINDFDINRSSGVFTFTPPSDLFGRVSFALSVFSGNHMVKHNFEININPVSDDPSFLDFNGTGPNTHTLPVATVGETYSYQFALFDADGDELILTVTDGELPNGLTIDGDQISGIPESDGNNTFQLSLSDGVNNITKIFSLESLPANLAPTARFLGQDLVSASTINLQFQENFSSAQWHNAISSLEVSDLDSQEIKVSIDKFPNSGHLVVAESFENFNPNLIRYSPDFNSNGVDCFRVLFSDTHAGKPKEFLLTFNIQIVSLNTSPFITSSPPPSSVKVNSYFEHSFEVFDAEEDFYELSFYNLPKWLYHDGRRKIYGKPHRDDYSDSIEPIFFSVTDQWGNSFSDNFVIEIIPDNYPPQIKFLQQSLSEIRLNLMEDTTISFELTSHDPDSNTTNNEWSVSKNPQSGTTFLTTSPLGIAEITYVPDGNFSGSDYAEISVNETTDEFSRDSIGIFFDVEPAPDIPKFESPPYPGIVLGKPWIFDVKALDGDVKDNLSLKSLNNLPEWLRLTQTSQRTWTFRGVPTTQENVVISLLLTDGNTSVEQSFSLKVLEQLEELDFIPTNEFVLNDHSNNAKFKTCQISLNEDANWSADFLSVNSNDNVRVQWRINHFPTNGMFSYSSGPNGTITDLLYVPFQNFHGFDKVELEAYDNYSTIRLEFNFEVISVPDNLEFIEIPQGVLQNADEKFDFFISYKDGDGLETLKEIVLSGFPSWLEHETYAEDEVSKSIRFFGIPPVEQIGTFRLIASLFDIEGNSISREFDIKVNYYNKPPVANVNSIYERINEDSYTEVNPKRWSNFIHVTDEETKDPNDFTWIIIDDDQNGEAQIDPKGTWMTYYPNPNFSGTDTFRIKVTDGVGYNNANPRSIQIPVTVEVAHINDRPIFISTPPSKSNLPNRVIWNDEQIFRYNVVVEDSDWPWQGFPELSLRSSVPSWARWQILGEGKAMIIGEPKWFHEGNYTFNIFATSGVDVVEQSFTLEIIIDDYPPRIFDSSGKEMRQEIQIYIDEDNHKGEVNDRIEGLTAINPDKRTGETLMWFPYLQPSSGGEIALSSNLSSDKSIASISDFSYSLPQNFNGIDSFALMADEGDRFSTINVEVYVKAFPDPPVFLNAGPLHFTVNKNSYVEYEIFANDPDGDVLTFRLLNSKTDNKWLQILQSNNESVKIGGIAPTFSGSESLSLVVSDSTGRFSILSIYIDID